MPNFKLLFMLSLGITAFCTQHLGANTLKPLTIDEVIAKHIEAIGGLYNWQKIESIRLKGKVERDGQVADIVIIKKRPNQIRATISLPIPGQYGSIFQIIRAHDGKNGWTATRLAGDNELQKESVTEEDAESLLNDAGILPKLIKLSQNGTKLSLLESARIQGQRVLQIHAQSDDSQYGLTIYLCKETYRIVQYREYLNQIEIITRLSDYKEIQGIWMPRKTVTETELTGTSIIQIDTVNVGVGIYKGYFEAP